MAEKKRAPYSVYLTPKANEILKNYVAGSEYGSASRTIEEIILTFDFIYKILKNSKKDLLVILSNVPKEGQVMVLTSLLSNIENSLLRLKLKEELVAHEIKQEV